MSEIYQIIWTAAATICGGVLVFVTSQVIQEYILSPLKKYKNTIAEIDNKLKFYANIIFLPINIENTIPEKRERYLYCSKVLRKLSCDLETSYKTIPDCIREKFCNSDSNIATAAASLIGLSNSLFENYLSSSLKEYNKKELRKIRELLNIRMLKEKGEE